MPNRHPRPEKAAVVERLLPRVHLRPREVFDREPDEDQLVKLAERFVAGVEAKGEPGADVEAVLARLRHVFRHADPEHQELVVLSSQRPPYFGVTTAKGKGVEVREV